MERISRDMTAAPMTGNPNRRLAVKMMLHHRGTIDMAHICLRDGTNPVIYRIAQKIMIDQEHETRVFQAWLLKYPARAQ